MREQKKLEVVNDVDMDELKGMAAALHRVQAVIEFDLEGNILDANDNFCGAIGYGLEEIKAIYQEVEQERIATQKLFDKESNHSIDHMKEVQWELRVARWLDGNFEE